MPRKRTTKKLAQRIELQYFTKPHPLRTTRFWLSIAAPVLAVLWLAWRGATSDRRPYSSGEMSAAHAVFSSNCAACHVKEASRFHHAAADRACLECHDGPIHHADQTFAPECSDCHMEHQGRVILAHTRDGACTRCHAQLETKGGSSRFVTDVRGFNVDHPQFAPLRAAFRDPGTIKLNHSVHLKSGLRGPDGRPVTLQCMDCHRAYGAKEPWRFGMASPTNMAVASPSPNSTSWPPRPFQGAQAYMAPPRYASTCASCHPLAFDKRFDEPVPHDKPEVVHAFVVKKFQEYIADHPAELRETIQPRGQLPERPLKPETRKLTPAEWVAERVADAELLLWRKTCKECHSLTQRPGDVLPEVAPSNITVRWLPHAVFDHQAHQFLSCESCHTGSRSSHETADVLIPGIRVCQQCHRPGNEAAENRCFECHRYHDWSKQKPAKASYTPKQLVRATSEPSGAAPSPDSSRK